MSSGIDHPLESAIVADLFAPGVRFSASSLRDCAKELSPSERELIRGVVPKREFEFATGRMLAKQLLAELHYPHFELLRDHDRVPIWPRDIVGSISHTAEPGNGLCIAAIASSRHRVGLGVDVEPDLPVKAGLEASICGPLEQEWVRARGAPEIGRRCRVIFSVKEAVYKAFFPRIREFWGFKDVEVFVDLVDGSFRANLPRSADREYVDGRILLRRGWILASVEYS